MTDADIVREWILKGAHDGWNGHHPNCSTKVTEGCDCYHRKYAPALAALDALVVELANATKLALDHQLCESRILAAEAERDRAQAGWLAAAELMQAAEAEVKTIKDAAQWLIDNRGHRGEEQAWKLLENALTDD